MNVGPQGRMEPQNGNQVGWDQKMETLCTDWTGPTVSARLDDMEKNLVNVG